MVPPPSDGLPEDTLECGICRELLLDPVTLSCCGKSFCLDCLRQLLLASKEIGVARCPAGCGGQVPFRLPPRSYTLQRCIEALEPEKLERRRREAAEDGAAGDEDLPGGFKPWEEVAAMMDLEMAGATVVKEGTPGVVLDSTRPSRVTVLFDERCDFRRSALHVMPFEIGRQLPPRCGVRLRQPVVAAMDLYSGDRLLTTLGTRGIALCVAGEDRIRVKFDWRADGSDMCVNVCYCEVRPHRKLLGGYDVGQRVAAVGDLFAEAALLVRSGTAGSVLSEYSDARLTVAFDERADGRPSSVNVLLHEIQPIP